MARWPPPVYRIQTEFDVPFEFAYRWCTDFQPDDSRRSKESYERRILERTARRVLYEDLWEEGKGWGWRRNVVTLMPPDHWHADSYGTFRTGSIDYRLGALPGDRCSFELVMRRRPSEAFPKQPAKGPFEADLRKMWRNFGRAMAQEYRAAQR
jgi:hypothetical protein